jgi:hypothetical protein
MAEVSIERRTVEMSQKKYRKCWLVTLCLVLGISLLWGCSVNQPGLREVDDLEESDQEEVDQVAGALGADVVSVEVTGSPNAYQFSVGIASPDEGCHQYADWWEVLSEEGELVYRRILTHSHVNEQPFVRSGGPVTIGADTVVVVRAHLHPGGYGGRVMRGTVQSGFEEVELGSDFAAEVESAPPQPTECAF